MIYASSVSLMKRCIWPNDSIGELIASRLQGETMGNEFLRVTNHTECECIYKNRPTTRSTRAPWTTRVTTRAPTCKCPSQFDAQVDDDGECGCVCKKPECNPLAEGKEGFTISDRRFVSSALSFLGNPLNAQHLLHQLHREQPLRRAALPARLLRARTRPVSGQK
jgi:hypothetical protein